MFLVCWSSKESNVPLWFLFLVFSLLKQNLQNKFFYLFLNLLFWTMSFFLLFFFLISFATWFLCKNVFFTSSCPPFIHPHSICSLFFCLLLFSRFLHIFLPFILNFFFWSFYYLYVSLCNTVPKKCVTFWDCSKTFFFCPLFSIEKTPFSLFPFLLSLFLHWFMFHVFCLFSVSWKNGFSFCITFLLKILLFNSVSLLYSILCFQNLEKCCCFLGKRWKNSIFCFWSLG